MKSSELHRLIIENGWILIRVAGSHYIYQKNDKTFLFLITEAKR